MADWSRDEGDGNPLDLLIVGAGPAGLLSAIIAAQLGLKFELIEKRESLHPEPSAHVIKTHSMEVYRRIGAADDILAESTPTDLQTCIVWCESIAGLCYAKLDLVGKKGHVPRFTQVSPVFSANVPQNVLEPILHRRLIAVADRDPVRFRHGLIDFRQDEDFVTARTEHEGVEREIRARYIIGADGAGSQVRRTAGIAMEGPQRLGQFLAIHIRSDARPLLDRHPGVVFFVRSPRHDGFFIMHQPVGSQVFMLRVDAQSTPIESFGEAQCRAIMDEVIGQAHDYEISSIDSWVMSAQVANSYRNGRALLIGDAGHRFPPTGGLGLNTGVEDVENLIWKLYAVLKGKAAPTLLDTYQTECRPIAIRNTRQSVKNSERMQVVATALRVDQGDDALAKLIEELKEDTDHPSYAELQRAVDDQIDHFAFLELELAASMRDGAFVPATRPIPMPVASVEGYQPSFAPGSYIPHFWVAPGRSSIDLARFDGFTLLVPAGDETLWIEAVENLAGNFLDIEIIPIDGSMRSKLATVADFWGEKPFAVLLRPDGRIGWVEPEEGDRGASLGDALARISHGQVGADALPQTA